MNGLYQTFFLLICGNLYCVYRYLKESREEGILLKEDSGISSHIIFWVLTVVHICQFFALKLQLFSSSQFRLANARCISVFQLLLMFLVPFLVIIIQIIWLVYERKSQLRQTVYYRWMITDVFLNSIGSIAYLIQLERITFEQKEASE